MFFTSNFYKVNAFDLWTRCNDEYTVLEEYARRIKPGDFDTLMRHTIHTTTQRSASRAEHVNTLHHKYMA